MAPHAPLDPSSSPWMHLAASVGKIGAGFLISSAFAALFAPIIFLLDAQSFLDPNMPAAGILALFTDPARMLAIGDFIAILGVIILSAAMGLILVGIARADKRLSHAVFILGGAILVCLVSWVPVMVYYQGTARGTITTVDAAAATGGWSIASFLLLTASLLYLMLTIRVEHRLLHRRLTSFWWPAYAAVNVLGSVAIAGFFAGWVSTGTGSTDALSFGLVLKVTLIPMLAVLAYGDLKDRFPRWAELRLHEAATIVRAETVVRASPATPETIATIVARRRRRREATTRVAGRNAEDVEAHGPLVTVTPREPVTQERTKVRPPPQA